MVVAEDDCHARSGEDREHSAGLTFILIKQKAHSRVSGVRHPFLSALPLWPVPGRALGSLLSERPYLAQQGSVAQALLSSGFSQWFCASYSCTVISMLSPFTPLLLRNMSFSFALPLLRRFPPAGLIPRGLPLFPSLQPPHRLSRTSCAFPGTYWHTHALVLDVLGMGAN